ncbi:dTDP-4-dehydrorhamnose 3,5-epimerase family protein [Serratia marcescens]|uniref:dTDP-4-dehydrorhamnose 3,5-epimerase family protein n=1 Tax=Serratia marcescens TaxID=615 RepID=UPI003209A063
MNVLTGKHGIRIVHPQVFCDAVFFSRGAYEKKCYQDALGIDFDFSQDNHLRSSKGVLRGLHFQKKIPRESGSVSFEVRHLLL